MDTGTLWSRARKAKQTMPPEIRLEHEIARANYSAIGINKSLTMRIQVVNDVPRVEYVVNGQTDENGHPANGPKYFLSYYKACEYYSLIK